MEVNHSYWQQLILTCPETHAEQISDWLSDHQALSVSMENLKQDLLFEEKIGSRPLWQHIKMTALYDSEVNCKTIKSQLLKRFPFIEVIEIERLLDQNWMQQWLDQYQALHIADHLWICPSWQPPPEPEAINIFLDPGMAFGTGTHPTTAMCLRWIANHIKPNMTLLDYGCGSGILAIAGVKLGAKQALATDIDEQALIVTQENAVKNNLPSEQLITCLPHKTPQTTVDLIIANILANPLISLAQTICQFAHPGSQIALSGLLFSQVNEVILAYQPFVKLIITEQIEDWVLLSGQFQ